MSTGQSPFSFSPSRLSFLRSPWPRQHGSLTLPYVIAYLAGISAATAYAYWSDKKKAETSSWRTPEKTLHLLELLGGWTAAFLSQRLFRHKITKGKYQLTFWLIGALHQYLSFDYLHQWRYTIRFYEIIESLLK